MSIKLDLPFYVPGAKTGLAMIALSGFVPIPAYNSARAASTVVTVTGKLVTGAKVSVGGSVKIGDIVATGPNGSVTVSVLGVVNPSKAITVGGAQQAGSFFITFVSTGPDADISVSNLGSVVLTPTAGGAGPTGTVKINKIVLDGFAAAPISLTDNGSGKDATVGVDVTTVTGTVNLGVQITWGGIQPIGNFSHPIILSISF